MRSTPSKYWDDIPDSAPGWIVEVGKPFDRRKEATYGQFVKKAPASKRRSMRIGRQDGPQRDGPHGYMDYIDVFVHDGGRVFYTVHRSRSSDGSAGFVLPGPRTGRAFADWKGGAVRFS